MCAPPCASPHAPHPMRLAPHPMRLAPCASPHRVITIDMDDDDYELRILMRASEEPVASVSDPPAVEERRSQSPHPPAVEERRSPSPDPPAVEPATTVGNESFVTGAAKYIHAFEEELDKIKNRLNVFREAELEAKKWAMDVVIVEKELDAVNGELKSMETLLAEITSTIDEALEKHA
jgi:hypothetical protein